ncbi:hypothetical protein Zmor_006557 [Zophobas morio]|uniref:Kinesin-like protein n=2 Tax=Zophobas morio TaxID=2755281 RepID=A0AA38IXF4_9CUCU|nr:hypothetical protein Zmor_006557 [Zophobas morio]
MEEFVNVSVRIRPPSKEEILNSSLKVINKQPAILLLVDKSQSYHFDNVFTYETTQKEIYNDTVKRLVQKVKAGYNCTVFAYGQTGTGKTYTIGTNPDIKNESEAGLISRALEDFFNCADEDNEVEITISFIEIYNEKVFDLLESNKPKHPLPIKGFTVQGFTKVMVHNMNEALRYLQGGSRQRHIGGTKQNTNSSRSHAIFSIHCCIRNSEFETVAKLNLVDLAGSESVRKTGNQGSSFYEGVNINKGLLSLGQVMTALSSNSGHVPYRQSVITTILQDSLNKRNFISLIACVSSNSDDLGETLQTLEFSNRVKKMKNKPEVNDFIVQYRKDNPTLFTNNGPKLQTPLKRSNGLLHETPFKKRRNVLPLIHEPALSENDSKFDISPLFSSSMTSVTSDHQQNFSPVLRKYMNQMESSLMNKLQDVITSTMKRPARIKFPKEDKENEMCARFDKDAMSDDDGAKLITSGSGSSITTESPVFARDNPHILNCSRTDRYSNNNNSLYHESSHLNAESDTIFKVPAPVAKTNNLRRKNSVQLQPKKSCDTQLDNTFRRRSLRIQMKNGEVNENDKISAKENISRRRSVRLQMKKVNSGHDDTLPLDSPEQQSKESTRVYSPSLACTCKKASRSQTLIVSPQDNLLTARKKQILTILNEGTLRQLEKLHTVGTKTAEKILLFRLLKGKFKSISDLKEMPYWTEKKYDKFMAENFLRN